MTVQENQNVPYHQQDTDVYCGAACAQMVLDSIGAGIQDQATLYTDCRNHTSELSSWYNPPDGLQWLMNDRRPAGFGGWFALYALNTEDALSRKLVWTIHHYQVAPIALVQGGNHWIVVRGYDASAAPTSSTDNTFTISAFEVNDPWPPVPSFYAPPNPPPPAPPPHSGGDNCGTGGNRGIVNQHIAYSAWKSTYMTGNVYGSLWNGMNVAVCDPDPPSKYPGRIEEPRKRRDGETLLNPEAARELAVHGLREYRLYDRDGWEAALRGAEPGRPSLVQRLDQIDSYYYIVPFINPRQNISVAVAVDARFGDYQQAVALPKEGTSILTALDKHMLQELVVDRRFKLEDPLGSLLVRKEAYCLYPTLVWRSCRESLSPFYPFHMFTVGDLRVYVRLDGQIFTKLHSNIPGI